MIERYTEDTHAGAFLGLPLKEVLCHFNEQGIPCDVDIYSSLRGVEGADDMRVLRVRMDERGAHIVVSAFLTEI